MRGVGWERGRGEGGARVNDFFFLKQTNLKKEKKKKENFRWAGGGGGLGGGRLDGRTDEQAQTNLSLDLQPT